jgi:glycosyltransferase involved in cell wall biosynthesis
MKINLYAPICNTGYGISAYNILLELYKQGHDVTYFNIGQPEQMPDSQTILNTWFVSNPKDIDINAPSIKIWHQHELYDRIGKGKHYGFPIFELDRFTKQEIESLKSCDELIVCSEWAKGIILNNLGDKSPPIHVVPLGVDPKIFSTVSISRPQTIFFNCGKWEVRKGHDVVLECFEKAFDQEDNVELWMMCQNPFPFAKGEEWEQKYLNSKLGNKIRLISRQPTQKNVYDIMKQVDCGVFPARAEGWNLELLEMMAIGKNVITTNYSGHTEFCNKNNSFLIDIQGLESAYDGIWFKNQGMWASIGESEKNQIINYMRLIHDLKKQNKLLTNQAGIETGKAFTWENSVKKLIKILS